MEKIEYNVELIGEIAQNDIDQEVALMEKLINACVSKKGYLTMADIYSAMERTHVFF